MFRKIHSNRDPEATVFKEIRKEFSPYFIWAQTGFTRMAQHYPRFLFAMMVINITLSIVLVLTVFKRKGDPPRHKKLNATVPLATGFKRIEAAGEALKQTIRLKREIDSLAHLKTLSHADSATLLSDLDSLRQIRLTINP